MVAVITGGSSGLGKGLAARCRERGYTVYVLSRTDPDGDAGFLRTDVSDGESVRRALEEIGGRHGRIDLLINNAGLGISGATELLDPKQMQSVMDVDFMGAFYAAKYALPYMERGCRIVNISSACALFALPFRTIYCAAKAGLQMLSYGLRMELAGTGIAVTAVCPGDTKTGFTKNRLKSYDTTPRYGDRVRTAAETVDKREEKRMPCDRVVRRIDRIASKRRPRAFYIVGGKYKLLYALSRLLPTGLFLGATAKFFGGKK